jgi:hypothetical protein
MDNVFIGKNGMYPLEWDYKSPFAYLPKEYAVLITRFFFAWSVPKEYVLNDVVVALNHESAHEAICKLVGEKESEAFDNVNKAIEEWLDWHFLIFDFSALSKS